MHHSYWAVQCKESVPANPKVQIILQTTCNILPDGLINAFCSKRAWAMQSGCYVLRVIRTWYEYS